jgi:hypothetical protein
MWNQLKTGVFDCLINSEELILSYLRSYEIQIMRMRNNKTYNCPIIRGIDIRLKISNII